MECAAVDVRSIRIEVSDLPAGLQASALDAHPSGPGAAKASHYEALDNTAHGYLTSLLRKHHGNVSQAAKQAGMSRQGMHKLLKKHGIAAVDYRD